MVLFKIANETFTTNEPINTTYLNEHLLVDAEDKFIKSTKSYPIVEIGICLIKILKFLYKSLLKKYKISN